MRIQEHFAVEAIHSAAWPLTGGVRDYDLLLRRIANARADWPDADPDAENAEWETFPSGV